MDEGKKNALLALAEQCERAEQPEREIDRAIAEALNLDQFYSCGSRRWKLTGSLDAAMTLKPLGARIVALTEEISVPAAPARWFAKLGNAERPGGMPTVQAATPALALCAAALRARAATPPVESRP